MKKIFLFIVAIVLFVLGLGIYKFNFTNDDIYVAETVGTTETTETKDYQFSGKLLDVIGGNSSGIAQSRFENGTYELLVTFSELPEPLDTDFYEGWVVRKGVNLSVISTGEAQEKDGVYQNVFTSNKDLTDHDFYVLTLEPDDGDPTPAEHILEGVLLPIVKKNLPNTYD